MTAVAPPINLTNNRWSGTNGVTNGANTMSADVERMLMPRKPAQRSNSSSSLNSLASNSSTSSTSTVSSASTAPKTNGVNGVVNGGGDWGSRKRTTRGGIWQPSKSEPIAGISTARPQSVNSATSGPSAASAISALHNPNGMSHQGQPDTQQNGAVQLGKPRQGEQTAVLYLTPMNGTFERKTINVPFYPDVLRIGRQTNNKTVPTPTNGFFDSKVLSRQHAEIWADRNGKIWIRDVKSSNGTFVNGQRLSQENKDSDPHELREQDMLELGIDIVSEDQKTVVHHKVAARVEHAGFYEPNSVMDLNFGDFDASGTSGLMGGNLGQALGQVRRSNSNTSLNSNGRMSIASAATNASNMQQRAPHFWLAPVNMDKIIQKLNAECKAAKQQSLDLQRAQQHIDSILATEHQPKKESSQKTSPIEKTKAKDSFRGRFSDPPAPPPQAPLPEKPDAALHRGISALTGAFQPTLNRSDTEKPKLPSLPKAAAPSVSEAAATATQFANLMDQLSKARQEVETERARLRETEDLLVQERVKREDAEERAKRLESQRLVIPPPSAKPEESPTPIEDEQQESPKDDLPDPVKLQERFDLLLAEFNEYKLAAEQWRAEKVQAEKERDEEKEQRLSLADMIEKIKSEEAARSSPKRKSRSRRRSRSKSTEAQAVSSRDGAGEDDVADEDDGADEGKEHHANGSVEKMPHKGLNGHPLATKHSAKASDQSDTRRSLFARRDINMTEAAPYISAISVVMIGVAVMALLNKMQRGESLKS